MQARGFSLSTPRGLAGRWGGGNFIRKPGFLNCCVGTTTTAVQDLGGPHACPPPPLGPHRIRRTWVCARVRACVPSSVPART